MTLSASGEQGPVTTGLCLWNERAAGPFQVSVESAGLAEPHRRQQRCAPSFCLLVFEMLNGAQALKGASHHDGQPGTQRLTLFHAMGQKRGGEAVGQGLPSTIPTLGISCLWEVRTTALPSLMRLTMVFHSMRRAWGSIPVVGSSCGVGESRGECTWR